MNQIIIDTSAVLCVKFLIANSRQTATGKRLVIVLLIYLGFKIKTYKKRENQVLNSINSSKSFGKCFELANK